MGGFSWLARRPSAAGDPTHALFAAQSHSIVDNLVALFEHSRASNRSNQERALADINGRAMSAIAGHPEYIAVAQPQYCDWFTGSREAKHPPLPVPSERQTGVRQQLVRSQI